MNSTQTQQPPTIPPIDSTSNMPARTQRSACEDIKELQRELIQLANDSRNRDDVRYTQFLDRICLELQDCHSFLQPEAVFDGMRFKVVEQMYISLCSQAKKLVDNKFVLRPVDLEFLRITTDESAMRVMTVVNFASVPNKVN